jgi:hypothetical protein
MQLLGRRSNLHYWWNSCHPWFDLRHQHRLPGKWMSDGPQKFPEFSLCPGGEHATIFEWSLHAQLRFDFGELCWTGRGKFYLSFALLCSSIRALTTKRTISNFRSNSWRVTWNSLWTDVAPSILLQFRCNLVQKDNVSVSFLSHYFLAPAEHFLRLELSQIFAPISGAGHATMFWPTVPPFLLY